MLIHLLKKSQILLLSLWIVITITFFLVHSIPGDPFAQDLPLQQEVFQAMRRHYKLDQPLHIQYLYYLKNVCSGNLGPSMRYEGQTVQKIIFSTFPISCRLGLQSLVIAIYGGIVLGTIAALNRGKWQEKLILFITTLGISMPSFILSVLLQYLFSYKLNLLPVGRWGNFEQTILPSLSLALLPMASITRLFSSSLRDVLKKDYIVTARSKGLSSLRLCLYHTLPNAILPVLTYLGPTIAHILMGSFIIEKVYAIPGLGQWFVLSISNNDYTMTLGLTLFYGTILSISLILIDLLNHWLDPRLRHG